VTLRPVDVAGTLQEQCPERLLSGAFGAQETQR